VSYFITVVTVRSPNPSPKSVQVELKRGLVQGLEKEKEEEAEEEEAEEAGRGAGSFSEYEEATLGSAALSRMARLWRRARGYA